MFPKSSHVLRLNWLSWTVIFSQLFAVQNVRQKLSDSTLKIIWTLKVQQLLVIPYEHFQLFKARELRPRITCRGSPAFIAPQIGRCIYSECAPRLTFQRRNFGCGPPLLDAIMLAPIRLAFVLWQWLAENYMKLKCGARKGSLQVMGWSLREFLTQHPLIPVRLVFVLSTWF